MSPLTELRPPVQQRSYRVSGLLAAVALGVLAILAVHTFVFRDPTFINTVRIDNPTDYTIHVELGTPDSGSRLLLGAAIQRCTSDFHTVIDQGADWVVSLRAQGHDVGAITVSRDQLARDDWTIHIPDSLSAELQSAAVPLPPDHGCPAPSQFR